MERKKQRKKGRRGRVVGKRSRGSGRIREEVQREQEKQMQMRKRNQKSHTTCRGLRNELGLLLHFK